MWSQTHLNLKEQKLEFFSPFDVIEKLDILLFLKLINFVIKNNFRK